MQDPTDRPPSTSSLYGSHQQSQQRGAGTSIQPPPPGNQPQPQQQQQSSWNVNPYSPSAGGNAAYQQQQQQQQQASTTMAYPPLSGSYPPSPALRRDYNLASSSGIDSRAPFQTNDSWMDNSRQHPSQQQPPQHHQHQLQQYPPQQQHQHQGGPPDSPKESSSRYHDPYLSSSNNRDPLPMTDSPYRSAYGTTTAGGNYAPISASGSGGGGGGVNSTLHTPQSTSIPNFSSDAYMSSSTNNPIGGSGGGGGGGGGGPLSESGSSREQMSPGANGMESSRSASNFAAFGKEVAPVLGLGEEDGDGRTRNAKAQKRHREKRKAFVKHLETSNVMLQSEVRRLNTLLLERGGAPAGPRCAGGPQCPSVEAHEAVLAENRDLLDQLKQVRLINDELRTQQSQSQSQLGRSTTGSIGGGGVSGGGAGLGLGGTGNGIGGLSNGTGAAGGGGGGATAYGSSTPTGAYDNTSYVNRASGSDPNGPRQFANNYLPPPSSLAAGPSPYSANSTQHFLDSRSNNPLK